VGGRTPRLCGSVFLVLLIFDAPTTCSQNDTEMKLEELKLIRRRIKEASEETKRKEQIIKQLVSCAGRAAFLRI